MQRLTERWSSPEPEESQSLKKEKKKVQRAAPAPAPAPAPEPAERIVYRDKLVEVPRERVVTQTVRSVHIHIYIYTYMSTYVSIYAGGLFFGEQTA